MARRGQWPPLLVAPVLVVTGELPFGQGRPQEVQGVQKECSRELRAEEASGGQLWAGKGAQRGPAGKQVQNWQMGSGGNRAVDGGFSLHCVILVK